jgi:RNA recognition motif-containing protein
MKVYVGNLPKQVNDAQLNELAVPFGIVQSANVVTDRANGESKGFGFLVFANEEGARAAITGLDGKDVHGQNLKVAEARPKDKAAARPSLN